MDGGWSRKSVSYCFCAALSYTHAHFPCERCNGKAVSRSTEYSHWKDSKAIAEATARTQNEVATSSVSPIEVGSSNTKAVTDMGKYISK